MKVLFLTKSEYNEFRKENSSTILKVTNFSKNWEEDFDDQVLISQISLPALTDIDHEVWISDKTVFNTTEDSIEFSTDRDKNFLRIEIHESESMNLEQIGFIVYEKIFELAKQKDLGNFVRAWNYIPNILSGDGNLERYRQFNVGQWNAWEQFGPHFENGLPKRPAMTGIGSFGGPVVVECFFSKFPITELENPRQTQFVHYSRKWGPKPPISARGTLHFTPHATELYIAGTASLIGEEVAHEGDIVLQTKETLKNIEVLIGNENLESYQQDFGFSLGDVEGIRVYVKNRNDLQKIQEVINEVWSDKSIMYVNDDICRPGFLLEIEGFVRKST